MSPATQTITASACFAIGVVLTLAGHRLTSSIPDSRLMFALYPTIIIIFISSSVANFISVLLR